MSRNGKGGMSSHFTFIGKNSCLLSDGCLRFLNKVRLTGNIYQHSFPTSAGDPSSTAYEHGGPKFKGELRLIDNLTRDFIYIFCTQF